MGAIGSFWPFWLILVVIGLGLSILQLRTWFGRRRKTYQEILAPALSAQGLEFISAVTAKLFDVGPFPKFEVEIGTYSRSTGPTGSGHYQQYRIVKVRDKAGREQEVWARLTFEFWNLKRVEWKPELGTLNLKDPPTV